MIDPVLDDWMLYLGVIDEMGWQLEAVLETHLHEDRLSAAAAIRQACGAKVLSGDARMTGADRCLADGEILQVGQLAVQVLATPGHTPACVSYLCADRLFAGDCLLIGDCGHLCGQQADPGQMYDSITRKLLSLPDETLLYPGHDANGRQVGCIGEERRRNPFFGGVSRDEFMARMTARQCTLPTNVEDIVARNMACGLPFSKSTQRSFS